MQLITNLRRAKLILLEGVLMSRLGLCSAGIAFLAVLTWHWSSEAEALLIVVAEAKLPTGTAKAV